jgi:hypothetical protein
MESEYLILKYFDYRHLPPELAEISADFHTLAHRLVENLGGTDEEVAAGLRKLLEAKDCFVRAGLNYVEG